MLIARLSFVTRVDKSSMRTILSSSVPFAGNVVITQTTTVKAPVRMDRPAWWRNGKNGTENIRSTSHYSAHEVYYLNPADILEDTPHITPDGFTVHRAVVRLTAQTSAYFFGRGGLYAALGALPMVVLFPLMDTAFWASLLLAPAVFCLSMPFGVAPAAIQEIMPNSMRGQASAIYLFVITLIGLGIGPTAVALVTDYVFGDDMALRYSLLIVTSIAVFSSIVLLSMSLKPYRESVVRLQQWAAEPA